jgi:hypothetical protein
MSDVIPIEFLSQNIVVFVTVSRIKMLWELYTPPSDNLYPSNYFEGRGVLKA